LIGHFYSETIPFGGGEFGRIGIGENDRERTVLFSKKKSCIKIGA